MIFIRRRDAGATFINQAGVPYHYRYISTTTSRASPQRIPRSLFPKLRDQHCPRHRRIYDPRSFALSVSLARVSRQAKRKCSNSFVSRSPSVCVREHSHMCARPVTRINPVHPHVKCIVKRKWPLRTGEPPPSPPLVVASRATSFPLSSAI